MKVALASIYDVKRTGGLSTHVHTLASGLRTQGVTVRIVTPYDIHPILYALLVTLPRNALYLMNKSAGLTYYYWISRRILERSLKGERIINFQDQIAIHSQTKARRILTVHGDLANMNVSDRIVKEGSPGHMRSMRYEKDAYLLADEIVAVDSRLKEHVEKIAGRTPRMLHNFVDTERFRPMDRDAARETLSLPNKRIIFCPRRLVAKNGVIFAVKAMERLSDDYLLLIGGVGPERDAILDYITKKDIRNISIIGDIKHEDMLTYYTAADIVTIPSVTSFGVIEATSISALEAMACGRVVVASGIGGLKEMIVNGKNGVLVQEQDPDALAKAFEKEYPKIPDAARTFVEDHHSHLAAASFFMNVYGGKS